jgi:quinoprotein glucose dehydrogenase
VCVKAATGEYVWHFQLVHHGLWDYDIPAAPIIFDAKIDGRERHGVAVVTKQGFVYAFDRVTGEPIWPIEERPVPQSDVPGERTSPTQPFPTKPPPFESQGITDATIIDFTPELRAEAMEILKNYRTGPMFTPPVVVTETLWGNVQHPGWAGGANWGGAAFDPETARFYVPSFSNPTVVGLVKPDPARSDFDWVRGHPQQEGLQQGAAESRTGITGPRGLPITKPPYGRVTAYDLSKGEIAWQVAHGEGIRQKIIDAGAPDPGPVGAASFSGPLLTKTLLFLGQGAIASRVAGEAGTSALTAYDKATGKVIANVPLPARPSGTPMSYVLGGKQYIVFATGGGPQAGILALALP